MGHSLAATTKHSCEQAAEILAESLTTSEFEALQESMISDRHCEDAPIPGTPMLCRSEGRE